MTMDTVNGLFEIGGALVTLLSVRQLLRDRCLMGAHWGPAIFFTAWGVWNLVFYPHLGQPVSTVGAALLVAVNAVYLGLMFRHRDRPGDPYHIDWGPHAIQPSEEAAGEIRRHYTSGPGPDFGDPRCGISERDIERTRELISRIPR